MEFPRRGDRVWLPYENLRFIKDVALQFGLGEFGGTDQAEAFRLRTLGHAIRSWNDNTGALSELEIDPLPHQIFLVHHILASGNLNWLIADDVGLGKTVEVGMLLSALIHRGQANRILVVCPAGLVLQWQEELHHKFGLEDFEIYGRDFEIFHPRQWRRHPMVVGSIDRFKANTHQPLLLQSGRWDLVIFDEAHRLSRRVHNDSYESAERFRLAARLRKQTPAFLLLTGTPHQGMTDKFQALLELLRPEYKDQIKQLDSNPQILSRMVIRNHKDDVTDAESKFVFHGKLTRSIPIERTPHEAALERRLRNYLRRGYSAAKELGQKGRAIGFVMTTYRKLFASSLTAIHQSLERRRQRLLHPVDGVAATTLDENDARYSGEFEELAGGSGGAFFTGELDLLDPLIEEAGRLIPSDSKSHAFCEQIIPELFKSDQDPRLLIFTEYRSTQSMLAEALEERFGVGSVSTIHGGLNYRERTEAIAQFEDHGPFLISTEAGGEGLNLHRRCHKMVNYDLPWNPMRLVQRVGRLYRYGQERTVVVLNLSSEESLDERIVRLLYDRIETVVRELAPISKEFTAGLEDEIMGQIANEAAPQTDERCVGG